MAEFHVVRAAVAVTVTADDFTRAATDASVARKIDAEVRRRREKEALADLGEKAAGFGFEVLRGLIVIARISIEIRGLAPIAGAVQVAGGVARVERESARGGLEPVSGIG